jgi:hypothetical protein
MDKNKVQEFIDTFNKLCAELGDSDTLTIFVKQKGTTSNAWQSDIDKHTYIDLVKLVKREIITVKNHD